MNKTILLASCGLAFAAFQPTAHADFLDPVLRASWYIEGRLGGPVHTVEDDVSITSNVAAANGTLEQKIRTGSGGAVAVGAYVTPEIRVEFEGSRLRGRNIEQNFKSGFPGNVYAGAIVEADGHVTTTGYMVNALYEFQDYRYWGITPFAGAGIGALYTHAVVSPRSVGAGTPRFVVDDSDTSFAGALILGADYPVNNWLSITGRYGFMIAEAPRFDGFDTAFGGGTLSAKAETIMLHTLWAGIRLKIN